MIPIDTVLAALRTIAPPELAADWDNVGLLVEAPDTRDVARCLLTIDLDDRVLDEAEAAECALIVAYHPPIFAPLRCLRLDDPKQRVILRAVARGISIYSPHTALDAAQGGVNDWLCEAFGPGARRGIGAPVEGAPGFGRAIDLSSPTPLDDCVARVKRHLGLAHVRVAAAPRHRADAQVRTIALCAGAGGSVLMDEQADLLLTGELRHHDVLAALARGTSVIVCDHSNTERGYLPVLRARLAAACPGVAFVIARSDEEPLRVV